MENGISTAKYETCITMDIVTVTHSNKEKVLASALNTIKRGGVVVTPSETQYGLSVDPANESAVSLVYAIKGRDAQKPLGLVAGSTEIIKNNFLINATEQRLMDAFWPGPLGLRLQIKPSKEMNRIAQLTLGNAQQLRKIVVRVSSNSILSELSKMLGTLVVSTSANMSGQPGCYDVKSVIEQFKNQEIQPDLIIDAGPLPISPPSTMIDASEKPYHIIRKGADFEEIKKVLETLE